MLFVLIVNILMGFIHGTHDFAISPKTRVTLAAIDGDEASTYINANFVVGADRNPKKYIAVRSANGPWRNIVAWASTDRFPCFMRVQAMAPLPATLRAWWRMIWQEQTSAIVMATPFAENVSCLTCPLDPRLSTP
jgi:protein tyrosine phosphatase